MSDITLTELWLSFSVPLFYVIPLAHSRGEPCQYILLSDLHDRAHRAHSGTPSDTLVTASHSRATCSLKTKQKAQAVTADCYTKICFLLSRFPTDSILVSSSSSISLVFGLPSINLLFCDIATNVFGNARINFATCIQPTVPLLFRT